MIHQVRPLPNANRLLPDVMMLQITVLEAASLPGVFPELIWEKDKDPDTFTLILARYFLRTRRFKGNEKQVASWITNKKETLLKPLSSFSSAAKTEKWNFIKSIRHDTDLLKNPRPESFKVAIIKSDPPWRIGAKNFLYEFYDLWKYGFPANIFSTPIGGEKYTYQNFVQEFVKENPELYICAICDGTAYSTRMEGHVYTSVEHFFPRSIYPHLSCHPLNLVPICSYCNSYIKGDEDPCFSKQNGQKFNLDDFVLPYQALDPTFRDSTYVAVIQRSPRPTKQAHPRRLELRPATSFHAGNKINAFNNLYKVDERWSESLHEIEDAVFRRVFQFLSLADPAQLLGNPSSLSKSLKILMAHTDLMGLGKDPYAYLTIWLLSHYIDQINDHQEKAPVFKALINWMLANQQRISSLNIHSEQIRQRVPKV